MFSENNIKSESLAATIVAYRFLGLCKTESRNAMIELMRRKNLGDLFDYEQYISDKLLSLSKLNKNSSDINNLLSLLIQFGNK
jgi:hypothetical protein